MWTIFSLWFDGFFNLYRKVPKEFHLDYDKLEDRPSLPANMTGGVSGGVPPSSAGSPAPPMGGNMGMQPPISSNMNSGPLPPSGGLWKEEHNSVYYWKRITFLFLTLYKFWQQLTAKKLEFFPILVLDLNWQNEWIFLWFLHPNFSSIFFSFATIVI